MLLALDSNVLIYAEGGNDENRRLIAHQIVGGVLPSKILVPIQSAAETLRWMLTKGGFDRSVASIKMSWWLEKFPTQDTNRQVFASAAELATKHRFQFFDAIVLAAAWAGGASLLLSEDMHDGFKWRGVTIANPFAANPIHAIKEILNNT